MEASSQDLIVSSYDSIKKVMFLTKQMLISNNGIRLISSTNSVVTACAAAETLKRLGYVEYENVQTETVIDNNARKTKCFIKIKKTKDFDRLYKENEEKRKEYEEKRKAENK